MWAFAPGAESGRAGNPKSSKSNKAKSRSGEKARENSWRDALWDSEALRGRPSGKAGVPNFRLGPTHVSILRSCHFHATTLFSNESVRFFASRSYNGRRGRSATPMQIVDLRQLHSRSLETLFQEESRHWREELHWDYRPSIELIRKFIDSRALGGYAALENGRPAGYGFYVLEDHKGLIGGLFVSSQYPQSRNHPDALDRNAGRAARHAAPAAHRSAADALRHRTRSGFSLAIFPLAPAPVHGAAACGSKNLTGKPLSSGLRLEPWTDRAFEAAARLIHLAYADHVDSQINDQYCSEAGGLKFLRNIVLLPGCGQFLPRSFLPGAARRQTTA